MTTLCIFAKAPEAGRVKTRLAADIGEAAALAVYQQLLQRTAELASHWPAAVLVCGTGDPASLADSPIGHWPTIRQQGATLGDRLAHGLRHALREAEGAIAIGTDCWDAEVADLVQIGDLLDSNDCCFGPAADGGYWALGVANERAVSTTCAADLPWSQPELLWHSGERCRAAGLRQALGPTRHDIDSGADLARARAAGFSDRIGAPVDHSRPPPTA